MKACWKCGKEWKGRIQPGREEVCETCTVDLLCCMNCKLHGPTMPNECRSITTEPVKKRDSRNFCDEFDMSVGAGTPPAKKSQGNGRGVEFRRDVLMEGRGESRSERKSEAKRKFDALFGE